MFKLLNIPLPLLIQPVAPRPITIEGFSHYLISYWSGILFNTKTGKRAKGWYNRQRYNRVDLRNGNKRSNEYIHRLVCMAWKSNPENKPEVNHLDKIRDSNSAINLDWVTHAENMAYIKCELHVEIIEAAPF